uniref:WW domain containing adaptor with coiled-coil a n=1 Tax=Gasterosteus aculeatus aculeatus TaxID=481459 RepID=A0AAQ4RHV0_GASAC
MQGNNRDSAMGATEEILNPIRRSNTRPRAIREGTAGMKRCETPPMSLLPARCSGGLTALKTNTPTAQATAERRLSIHTGPETGTEGPVILHKKILTTTVPFIALTCILTPARPQTHLMNLGMTGRSTSAHLERNTITTAGQRCPSGRGPKSGSRESSGKKRRQRRRSLTVFPKTETTEGRPCKHQRASPAQHFRRVKRYSIQSACL